MQKNIKSQIPLITTRWTEGSYLRSKMAQKKYEYKQYNFE